MSTSIQLPKVTTISSVDHSLSKTTVPSQKAIYEQMLAKDDNFSSTLIPKNKVARFLESGLKIQAAQYDHSFSLLSSNVDSK